MGDADQGRRDLLRRRRSGFRPRLYREWAKAATCKDPISEALARVFTAAPVDPDHTSLVSRSTEVLSVTTLVSEATVDVSEFPIVGAAFEGAAVQQLVWTVTAADRSVRSVRLLVDGEVPPRATPTVGPGPQGQLRGDAGERVDPGPIAGGLGDLARGRHGVRDRVGGQCPAHVYLGGTVVARTVVTTMMGGFAQATTRITLPPGSYELGAYNDSGKAESWMWDTKEFTVR